MIDETVKAALIVLTAALIKFLFGLIGFPLSEEMYFTLAGIIVAYILMLLGYEAVKAIARKAGRGYLFKQD